MNEIRIKVADFAVGAQDDVLVTIGLGSCVAIMLHDASARLGALAHVLLPTASMSREPSNHAKFAETAVPMLVAAMRERGSKGTIRAKLAGGASMFAPLLKTGGVNMGERNVEAARAALAVAGIALLAEDVGGESGRSIYFSVADGSVMVKTMRMGHATI